MRKLVSIASAAFSLVLGAGPLHAASVEAYGRPPSIDNVSVSGQILFDGVGRPWTLEPALSTDPKGVTLVIPKVERNYD